MKYGDVQDERVTITLCGIISRARLIIILISSLISENNKIEHNNIINKKCITFSASRVFVARK